MRWLVVGALGVETRPLIWRLSHVTRMSHRLHQGHHPSAPAVEVGVLRCGVGPDKALEHTTEALKRWPPDAVLSIGTCGALVDSLRIGDVRTVGALFRGTHPCPALTPLAGPPVVALSTVAVPCWTQERRTELARTGAELVEMEAAAVAEASRGFDPAIPVHALKIVSDQAGAEPDPVVGAGAVPNPLRVARFKLRALKLSHQQLVPALLPLLAGSG